MPGRLIPHPHVVARLGGIPVAATAFPGTEARGHLDRMRAARREAQHCASDACDRMEAEVPVLFTRAPAAARALIQVKRDLFNGRAPRPAALARVDGQLTPECARSLGVALAALADAEAAEAAWPEVHAAELQAGHAAAFALYASADDAQHSLSHALALTNPALHARLQGALERPLGTDRDSALLCISLARYALRAARKTSPLSSLGVVALTAWSDLPAQAAQPASRVFAFHGPVRQRRQPRFAALDYVFEALLGELDRIDGGCPVALNTSLRREQGQWMWSRIKNDDVPESRTRGARLARNKSPAPFVEALRRIFAATGHRQMPLDSLRSTLAQALGGDAVRAEAVLRSAWGHGLLQPHLPARDTPLQRMHEACALLAPPLGAAVAEALTRFEAAVQDDSRSDAEYARTLEACFEALLRTVDADTPTERFRPLVFEDCTLPPAATHVPTALYANHQAELLALLRAIPLLTANAPQARLRHALVERFRAQYGDGGVCTDVHAFLDDCADALERLFSPERTPARAPDAGSGEDARPLSVAAQGRMVRADTVRRRFFARLARAARDGGADTLAITPELLTRCAERARAGAAAGDTSKMCFVQPAGDADQTLLVVNHVYPGASCTVSRFIPDDPAFVEPVRGYLAAIARDGRFMELGGIFGFNANLHPPLAEHVLDVPPFPAHAERAASFDALRLRHRPDHDALVFEDAEGHTVDVFFLGILTPLLMPRAYQVVRTLGFSADRIEDIGDQLAQHLRPDATGVIRIPRVCLGALVLVRRAVAVRAADLPDPALDPAEFFARFTAWADDCGLPPRVFSRRARVASLYRDAAEAPRADWKAMPGKEAKPMPLDRDCPLMVRIFQKALGGSALDVVFSEALPDPFQTPFRRDEAPVVGEFAIELSLREEA